MLGHSGKSACLRAARRTEMVVHQYTIGVFDTCGGPELITVGLNESTTRHLLNDAARLLRTVVFHVLFGIPTSVVVRSCVVLAPTNSYNIGKILTIQDQIVPGSILQL